MTNLTTESKIKRIDTGVAETNIEDKVILLHIENGEYYNFNDTSSLLWLALKEPKQIGELAFMLTEKFECNIDECKADVITWIEDMLSKGLVTVV